MPSSSLQIQRVNSPIVTTHHNKPRSTNSSKPPQLKPHHSHGPELPEHALIDQYHAHDVGPAQCSSVIAQRVRAPTDAVWALVRRFDQPHVYKHFLKSCHVVTGGDPGRVGALREVRVVSGLPACTSTERLEVLDDERRVTSFRVVGGDHRLKNYRSVTTLHDDGGGGTLVVESYVVDVPEGNTREETCAFVDTIVRCNLQSLAKIAESMTTTTTMQHNIGQNSE